MWDGRMFFEIFLATFAVIGFYSMLKMIGERIFPTECLDVAIRLCNEEQVEQLDILLNIAASQRRRGRSIVVLISSHLMYGAMGYGEVLRPELEALLRQYGAECFVVDIEREKT